jgi:hypothetical protein
MPISRHTKLLPFLRRPYGAKYELLFQDSRIVSDASSNKPVTAYRIRTRMAVPGVGPSGTLGGYVQSLDNLSQEGDCWIFDQACVIGKARIWGNARVSGEAMVREDAWVFEEAQVYGKTLIGGSARVFGQAILSDEVYVGGQALISGKARICGQAHVAGRCWVAGSARLTDMCWVHGAQIFTKGEWPGMAALCPHERPNGDDYESACA